jgi:hypothetical protein
MKNSLDRRTMLKLSASAAVVSVAGPALLAPAASAETAEPDVYGDLPPVPGMLGDRRANELWYQVDEVALYHPAPETSAAYQAIFAYLGPVGLEQGFFENWLAMSKKPEYPHNYTEFVRPIKEPLTVLSKLQLGLFDKLYRPYDTGLIGAFAAFGQGILFDPRRAPVQSEVHTMNGLKQYHVWHAIQRAMMFLDIDRRRWSRIDPVLGFAWALQSIANPKQREVSPPLPAGQVRTQARYWLLRDPIQLDQDFQSVPRPAGIS